MRYKSDFTTSVSSNKELNFNLHNRARQIISPPSAKPADLLTVHEAEYLAELAFKNSKESYDELLAEAGCVLSVVGQIHSNKCSNGLCLVPPGGEPSEATSLLEDEHTRDDEVRKMATDIMATSTTKPRFARRSFQLPEPRTGPK